MIKPGIIPATAALFFIFFHCSCQTPVKEIDTLEFQSGYPNVHSTALQQLQTFPTPRYKPHNDLTRLFSWMNPFYLAGGGQEKMLEGIANLESVKIQEEMISRWNYFIYIPNSGQAANPKNCSNPNTRMGLYIALANKHPEIPLGLTTFWMQLAPQYLGYKQNVPNILRTDLPDQLYIKNASGDVVKKRLNFAAPDSLFIQDGQMQKQCIQNILNNLTRPIDLINENGEEPPGANLEGLVKADADMIKDKEQLGIGDWHTYISKKKAHMRTLYSSQFMTLPALKNTKFTIYCVEGGPIDRFDWQSTKMNCSPIKGNYLSTPDFYPTAPDNWKTWKGAWHGWKWINDGRKVELKNGDKLFSPFIAAGWNADPQRDIRPAQWLGLLKCLSVVGAEFYYVAYFNLAKPFSNPENYVWQAAMPAYAQAVTSRFGDIFRNGNVLFDKAGMPIVTYPLNHDEQDVIVTVRKHDHKEQYIIAATVQPSSNTERTALKKNVEISIGNEKYVIEARRQGSVYFLDKSSKPYVFYQLDRWHQYEHPQRWRKELVLEAELADTSSAPLQIKSTYSEKENTVDFSKATARCTLAKNQWLGYYIAKRDVEHLTGDVYVHIYAKAAKSASGIVSIDQLQEKFSIAANTQWNWITVKINRNSFLINDQTLIKIQAGAEDLEVDKICISNSAGIPDLSNY